MMSQKPLQAAICKGFFVAWHSTGSRLAGFTMPLMDELLAKLAGSLGGGGDDDE